MTANLQMKAPIAGQSADLVFVVPTASAIDGESGCVWIKKA
jgi:hypothetical protein